MILLPDFIETLNKILPGQLRADITTRLLYSTDASIYQIDPLGVVDPRDLDELAAIVEIASDYGVPILARGSGSSLAGQAIGTALIIDCSKHLNRIVNIDPEERTALVEPGVILTTLNRAAARHGLQFGPDPASAERATMGGSISNNATGAHSILYGMTADHLLSADVVLSDGSLATLEAISLDRANQLAGMDGEQPGGSVLSQIYRIALRLRQDIGTSIRQGWPHTWRVASGYNINYLLPWSPSAPPLWGDGAQPGDSKTAAPYPPVPENHMNLAPLLAGSEGTLAVIRRATVRLVLKPRNTCLGVLAFPSIADACDAAPQIMRDHSDFREPSHYLSAIELIPQSLIDLARSIPAYAHQLSFVDPLLGPAGAAPNLLVVEFSGDEPSRLKALVSGLGPKTVVAESQESQRQVWNVRKVGLGILLSRPGDVKPVSFIEDVSVPVDRLGDFVRGMESILTAHGTQADYYAHASAGCLHIRPFLNLKTIKGVADLRSIASEVVKLTISLKGALSGEHGDGIARSEWLEGIFGVEIVQAFKELKRAADPRGILNPGKIVPVDGVSEIQPMDINLRYGDEYKTDGWEPIFNFPTDGREPFPASPSRQGGLANAIELCNGAGVCRKAEGVMCPSFQVTNEEMHSTRGRANLLRAYLTGRFPSREVGGHAVKQALDLCLACKGCKSECPSGVDVAKLKYEFLHHYYSQGDGGRRRPLRDYLFGYIDAFARLGRPFTRIANPILASIAFRKVSEKIWGLSSHRSFPPLAGYTLHSLISREPIPKTGFSENVLLLSDTFTEYFQPHIGLDAVHVLANCGVQVILLNTLGAGRTLISKGFLPAAKKQATRLLDEIGRVDPDGKIPVVGIEPSEIYTLRDEYIDFFPAGNYAERARSVSKHAFMIDEFLVRPGVDGYPRNTHLTSQPGMKAATRERTVLLHGHCYQKAQPPSDDGYPIGVPATVKMLHDYGYQVDLIDAGCCGMAGAFGYEAEHYSTSMKVGELNLFPTIRDYGEEVLLAASGFSCQAQIEDGCNRGVFHPISLLRIPE